MATIKSYTDLEQSKKLAEILPLESADMYYPWYIEEDGDTIESGHRINTPNIGNFITHKINKMILPCWSLAALLSVLPKCIGGSVLRMDMSENDFNLWFDDLSGIVDEILPDITKDNPVDACYEMILKLHELNLL